tara:strand:- start:16 stop:1179 length:1164 start_codon:yes stop_codon:yes gene_type:complete
MTRSRDTADQINRINSSAANATAITVDSSENVSLTGALDVTGTATANKVTIGTSSASNGKLTLEGVDGGNSAGIYFNNTTATNGKSYSLSSGNSGEFMLYDRTSNAYRLVVDTSGNVLVGTNNAAQFNTSTETGSQVSDGYIAVARPETVAYFNRLSTDGDIVSFRKGGSTVGSIGTTSGDITIDGASEHTGLRFEAGAITPRHNGAASNSYVDLGSSSVTWENLYLDGGVVFGPASASTVSSQTLETYEEGVYTPTITCGSGSITLNGGIDTLAYIKVGRVVTVTGLVVAGSVSSPSSSLKISLPFVSKDSLEYSERTNNIVSFWCNGTGVPNGSVYYNAMLFLLQNGQDHFNVYLQGYNGSYNVNPADWIGTGSDIHVNFTYFSA